MPADPRLMALPAIRDVLAEREKQRAKWGDAHDDEHDDGVLAAAATYLAWPVGYRPDDLQMREDEDVCIPAPMWAVDLSKRAGSRRQELVMAAALLLAEIERMDRANLGGAS